MKLDKQKTGKYIYRGTILATVLGIGVISFNMASAYKEESVWKKKDSTPLASLEPFMLYLEEGDFQKLRDFDKSIDEIYDSEKNEFTKKASNEQIDEIKKVQSEFSEGLKKRTDEKMTRIQNLWKIKTGFDEIVNSKGEIKKDVTPKKIEEFIKSNWTNLITHIDKTKTEGYFKNIYDKMISVSSDTTKIIPVIQKFNSSLKMTDEGLLIPADTDSSLISGWDYVKNSTENTWLIVKEDLIPYMDKAKELLKEHDSNIARYKTAEQAKLSKSYFEAWAREYRALEGLIIDLPNFVGQSRSDVELWLADNPGVRVNFIYDYSPVQRDQVLSQYPTTAYSNKILNNATIDIVLSREEERPVETTTTTFYTFTEQRTINTYGTTITQRDTTFTIPTTTSTQANSIPQTQETTRFTQESSDSND